MSWRRFREELAWWLAVLAAGLLCLMLLPFYPLALLFWKLEDLRDRLRPRRRASRSPELE